MQEIVLTSWKIYVTNMQIIFAELLVFLWMSKDASIKFSNFTSFCLFYDSFVPMNILFFGCNCNELHIVDPAIMWSINAEAMTLIKIEFMLTFGLTCPSYTIFVIH